jgi:hypothetical protein
MSAFLRRTFSVSPYLVGRRFYPGEKRRETMNLEQIKYSTCPFDQEEGVLLTDIEETSPQTDEDGDLQYYCVAGNHMYILDEDED